MLNQFPLAGLDKILIMYHIYIYITPYKYTEHGRDLMLKMLFIKKT